MTANKHTPGPWFITRSGMGIHKYVEARIGGGMVQEVACCGPTEVCEQSDANARLIAAAPELLELARELWVDVRHNNEEDEPYGQRVQAVIAKATGETP